MRKVGIPRALFFYKYYPLWKSFFEELGAEVVVSDATTKKILDDGIKSCVDEACLPVKLFHGHVMNIKNRVDCLFIPRLTSISKGEYICPKFGGLPDMVRNSIKDLPYVIDPEINLRKSNRSMLKAAYNAGKHFCRSRRAIRTALKRAILVYNGYKESLKTNGLLPYEYLENKRRAHNILNSSCNQDSLAPSGDKLNIAIIGHIYNLNDGYINMRLIDKLRENNVNVITIEMIDSRIINEKARELDKRMFWYFGRKAIGSIFHLLERRDVDGIIYIMSFGCGIDSFVCDIAERKIRKNGRMPFIVLTLDEHSGEAGINTRLEAFIDMIRWNNKHQADSGKMIAGNL